MSGAAAGAIGAATGAAIAVAAKIAMMREEEEKLTPYNNDELDGWEFKIVRAGTGKFKNSKAIQQLCAEEAPAGWVMVEKFDNSRIRFKRRTDMRSHDQYLGKDAIDPYRTTVSGSETKIVLIVIAALVAVILIAALVVATGHSN